MKNYGRNTQESAQNAVGLMNDYVDQKLQQEFVANQVILRGIISVWHGRRLFKQTKYTCSQMANLNFTKEYGKIISRKNSNDCPGICSES